MPHEKPHMGIVRDWVKEPLTSEELDYYHGQGEDTGLGYMILGTCVEHPKFGTSKWFHTSWVMSHNEETGEIETRNSRYTLK